MQLIELINAEGLTGTAAVVHSDLTTKRHLQTVNTLRSQKETLVALQLAGIDPEAVLEAVESTRVGVRLLAKLAVEGVNCRDPITKQLLGQLVINHPLFTQDTMDVLVGMNEQTVSLCEQYGITIPTEAEVQTALDAIALESDWITAQNTHINTHINSAVAAGDRAGLVAALRAAADEIEANI